MTKYSFLYGVKAYVLIFTTIIYFGMITNITCDEIPASSELHKQMTKLFEEARKTADEEIPLGEFDPLSFAVPGVYEFTMNLSGIRLEGGHKFEILELKEPSPANFELDLVFNGEVHLVADYKLDGKAGEKVLKGEGKFRMTVLGLRLHTTFEYTDGVVKNYNYTFKGVQRSDAILENLTLDGKVLETAHMEALGKDLFNQFEEKLHDVVQARMGKAMSDRVKVQL